MTNIRFLGDVPLWLGVLAAIAAALAAWFYYRRERHDLPLRLRTWLPLLRATAVLLTVLVLTGPVLRHRRVEGRLGRVVVFLDGSLSMSAHDRQLPGARKLLIARQQGMLPPDRIDPTLWHAAERLASVRRYVEASLEAESVDVKTVERCRERLAREADAIAASLEDLDDPSLADPPTATPTWRDIGPRFHQEVLGPAESLLDEPIDQTGERQTVVAELLGLADAAGRFDEELRAAFGAYASRLLESGAPALAAAAAQCDETSRWQRAENSLLHPEHGLLPHLAETHDVEVAALDGAEVDPLWNRLSAEALPSDFHVDPEGPWTDLGSPLAGRMSDRAGRSGEAEAPGEQSRTAVVLLTDGRHNRGDSPLEAARLLGGQAIPIHTVGFGARREPPDLALLDVEHPDLVFQKDRVRGTLLLKDQMPAGQPFAAQIAVGDEILWQEQLTTQDVRLRRVDFEFSVDQLVEDLSTGLDPDVKHHAYPLALEASLAPLEGETEASNNEAEFRLSAITQSYRLLLLDGRSRWETRYLRNLFERDDQWHIDTILAGPATGRSTLPRGEGRDRFPADRDALFQYDLIAFGDIPTDLFSKSELKWIREFVEVRGGGLVFIDGNRGHLDFGPEHPLAPLLPVERLKPRLEALPSRLQLTASGNQRDALMLARSAEANERLWQELPAPRAPAAAEALADTETLVEAVVGERLLPVIVTRTFGAGRVCYSATDETWRWRYKAADTYHQRFWNQVARWVMPRPYAVSDEYVSLDTGPPAYDSGETIDIRVRLRGPDGRPASDATVDALLRKNGRIASTVTLHPDQSIPGTYRGRTAELSEGSYEVSVRASGFSRDALRARTRFVVRPPENRELELTACNENLLEEMARRSGGRFLREEQFDELADLLVPLSSGRVVESETLLWQSYWWFTAIILLLSIEWLLRKRAGLL